MPSPLTAETSVVVRNSRIGDCLNAGRMFSILFTGRSLEVVAGRLTMMLSCWSGLWPVMEKLFPKASYQIFVAEIEGKFAGYCYLQSSWVEKIVFYGATVDPEFRSRGAGARLMQAAVLQARKRGKEKILLAVALSNTPAVKIYERFGFSPMWIQMGKDLRKEE